MSSAEEDIFYGPFEDNEAEPERADCQGEDEFDLDEADMFVDEASPMLSHLNNCEEPLIGMEQIVDDQTRDRLKCILCRVILRDRHAIINHLKDIKHQSLYLERFHPVVYNCLTGRRESAAAFCDLVGRYAVELVQEQGLKRCRTYVKGYGKASTMNDNGRPDSRQSFTKSTSGSRSYDSHHRHRHRHRTRSRSPHRFESTSRNDKSHRHYRRRNDSPPGTEDVRRHGGKKEENSGDDRAKREKIDTEEDVYGELPPDSEISGVLLMSTMMAFDPDEKALVHDVMDAVKRAVVGLKFIAEYADPRGAYQPGYLCALCESRFSPVQITTHVVSQKHRLKYMERQYKTYYSAVTMRTLPEEKRQDLISRYAREIEKKEGRGAITRKIVIADSDRFIFSHHKYLTVPAYYSRKRAPRGQPEVVDQRAIPFPPKVQVSSSRVPLPQRPNFIYSEETEKAKRVAEIEKILPPFVERNFESGWYSLRQLSLAYYQRLVRPMTPYVSIRCPHAMQEMYGTWSPYVMRRIQDQFNFSLDHLTWLQKLLLDWRIPLSKPLEEDELRPLADDVESAVLKSLVGQVLQPNNFFEKIHDRVVFEYDDRPTEESKRKPAVETIEYELGDAKSTSSKNDIASEQPQKFVRERRPSSNSVGSSNVPSAGIQLQSQTQPGLLTLTPSEDDQRSIGSSKREISNAKAVAERAMLALIDQVLQTAKDSKAKNPLLSLLLSLHNARSILFSLATKQPAVLQQLVVVMKNPNLVIPPETLALLEKKLRDLSNEFSESAVP